MSIRPSAARFLACLALGAALLGPFGATAQGTPAAPARELSATILGPDDIQVGRTIILDASASRIAGSDLQYAWYVNNESEPISRTVDAIYTPERPGELRFRLTLRSTVDGEIREDEETHVVAVFTRKVVLVTDASLSDLEVTRLRLAAATGSTYLRVLRSSAFTGREGGEQRLLALLEERGSALLDAESVVLWTDSIPTTGLFALMRAAENDLRVKRSFPNQALFLVTTLDMRTIARSAKGPISVLQPRQTYAMRPFLVEQLLTAGDDARFLQRAFQLPTDVPAILDASGVQISPFYLLTRLINAMLSLGVSSQTILLLLVLPIIATILSFLKQVVGMTTFGLFTPAIIALSFLVLGWEVGVLSLLFILMTGYAARSLMRRLHILYVPKMAIILVIGSITLLLLVGLVTLLGVRLGHDTVFVLLVMSTLVESFLNVKSEQGLRSAILAIGQTVVAALLCVLIVQWGTFRALLLGYPEIILLMIPVNILLGRWTGLRITEYFRFREVFKHLVQE